MTSISMPQLGVNQYYPIMTSGILRMNFKMEPYHQYIIVEMEPTTATGYTRK